MDRAPYQLSFTPDRVPNWRCPSCKKGHLTLEANMLLRSETAQSRRESDHPAWEPWWTRTVFSCIFACSNADCKEAIACSGDGFAEMIELEDEEFGWGMGGEDRFQPRYFEPPLILMDLPQKCPEAAVEHLIGSFRLAFADPGASLNSARAALEAVLTDIGVRRYDVCGNKRRPVNLHRRIELLPPKFKEQIDSLLAVKWLGNVGSHDGAEPKIADVFLMYDILENALSEIYDGRTKKLKAVVKSVIAKKGRLK